MKLLDETLSAREIALMYCTWQILYCISAYTNLVWKYIAESRKDFFMSSWLSFLKASLPQSLGTSPCITPLALPLDWGNGTVTALLTNTGSYLLTQFPSSSKHLCLPLDQGQLDTPAKQKAIFSSKEKNPKQPSSQFSLETFTPTTVTSCRAHQRSTSGWGSQQVGFMRDAAAL